MGEWQIQGPTRGSAKCWHERPAHIVQLLAASVALMRPDPARLHP